MNGKNEDEEEEEKKDKEEEEEEEDDDEEKKEGGRSRRRRKIEEDHEDGIRGAGERGPRELRRGVRTAEVKRNVNGRKRMVWASMDKEAERH